MRERTSLKEILERVHTGHVPGDSYVRKCLEDYLGIRLGDVIIDSDPEDFVRMINETGRDTDMKTLISNMAKDDKRPTADEILFLCMLTQFDLKKRSCYEKLNHFLDIPLADYFHVINRLPKTGGEGRIDRMDFQKSYDEWIADMVKKEDDLVTIRKMFDICYYRLVSFHDDMALGAPWEEKTGTREAGGIYYDDKEKDESVATTVIWLMLICAPARYIRCKEKGLLT